MSLIVTNPFEDAANAEPFYDPKIGDDGKRIYTDKDYADAKKDRVDAAVTLDLRDLVESVAHQLNAIQQHYFEPSGKPKATTDATAISSYMRTNLQLLGMLQKFEDALSTDADVRKIEIALEMTFEDMQVPDFQETFKKYLEQP
jgi:uncharacterized protein YozE (UPF0346 family)